MAPMLAEGTFEGKVAVVTGGGTGMGRAMALEFARLGAGVVVAGRRPEPLEEVAVAIREGGGRALAQPTDVRQPDQVDALFDAAVDELGRVDVLVNNAAGNFVVRAEDLSPNGWNSVIGIVLNGTFYCSRAVGRYMIGRRRGGSIVSILANYIWTGSPGTIHSAAAKAGVMSMTQTLAVEWAPHGIRVNAVAPGPIESAGAARQLWSTVEAVDRITNMVPLQRWGTPGEVADAVAFLAAPQSGFITGEILTIDGGARLNSGTFGFIAKK